LCRQSGTRRFEAAQNMQITPKTPAAPWLHRALLGAAMAGAALVATPALAQFSMVPAPLCTPPKESATEGEREYRVDAARHLYACYPMRVYRGKLPPLLYGVMMVETEIDATGQVVNVSVVRKPAADEVAPWVIAMIKRAAPFPAPAKQAGGTVKYTETYFVDKSGLFQAQSVTEGQR
jgi:protein TonB